MQVREQDEAFPQAFVLGLDRLLHLQQELRFAPDLADVTDPRPSRLVRVVRKGTADARISFDQDLVPVLDELARARRRQRDAVLVRLDLFCDTDPHGARTLSVRPRVSARQSAHFRRRHARRTSVS